MYLIIFINKLIIVCVSLIGFILDINKFIIYEIITLNIFLRF